MKRKSTANSRTAGKKVSEHRYYKHVEVVVKSVLDCFIYMTNGMTLIPHFQVLPEYEVCDAETTCMLLVAKLMAKLCLKQQLIDYAQKFLRVYNAPFPVECQYSEENREKIKDMLDGLSQHNLINVDVVFE